MEIKFLVGQIESEKSFQPVPAIMPDLRFRTVLEMKRDFGQWDRAIFYFYSVVFTLLESIV